MIKLKEITPRYTQILTTAYRYEEDKKTNGVILDTRETEGAIKEYQKIIKVGSSIRDLKPGQTVALSFNNYAKKKYDENSLKEDFGKNEVIEYHIPVLEVNDEECLLMEDRDVMFIIDDMTEEKPKKKKLVIPEKKIIVN